MLVSLRDVEKSYPVGVGRKRREEHHADALNRLGLLRVSNAGLIGSRSACEVPFQVVRHAEVVVNAAVSSRDLLGPGEVGERGLHLTEIEIVVATNAQRLGIRRAQT